MESRTIRELLESRVKETPGKKFFDFEDREGRKEEINYHDFDKLVNGLANSLMRLGVKKGDKVSILMLNCPEYLVSFFATSKVGAICSPINTGFRDEEVKYHLNHSESNTLILQPSFWEKVQRIRDACPNLKNIISTEQVSLPDVILFSELIKDTASPLPMIELSGDDGACLMYTSGTSTGNPKGVLLTHYNFINANRGVFDLLKPTSEDRIMFVTPLFHANALMYASIISLLCGGSLVFTDWFSASRFWSLAKQYKPTIFFTLGTICKLLLNTPETEDEHEHTFRAVYAPGLGADAYKEFKERFKIPIMVDCYSMSELGGVFQTPIDGSYKPGSVGFPDPHLKVKIVDEAGKEVPPGTPGEVIVKFENIMKGYYKNPEAMSHSIKDGWFYTGDILKKDEEGCFYYVDRKSDRIRRKGENISAREVEEVLNSHPKILESAVIGVPDKILMEEIKAYLIVKPGETPPSFEEIVEYCKEKLADFKLPRYLEYRESFPKTATGRIQKVKLKEEARLTQK